MRNRRSLITQLRALLLLLVLLGGPIAAPVAMALPPPVTCGMACCEEAGVCYCAHAHAETENTSGPQVDRIRQDCGERCAGLPGLSLKLSAVKAASHPVKLVLSFALAPSSHRPPAIQKLLLSCERSPRSPPALLTSLHFQNR